MFFCATLIWLNMLKRQPKFLIFITLPNGQWSTNDNHQNLPWTYDQLRNNMQTAATNYLLLSNLKKLSQLKKNF